VIDVSHDGDDRRTRLELALVDLFLFLLGLLFGVLDAQVVDRLVEFDRGREVVTAVEP
jgi:hypothetical protein